MAKRRDKVKIPTVLKAQRPPEAMWLWLPGWRQWQRCSKAVDGAGWLAFNCGLVTDPRKRAVWEQAGPEGVGLVALLSLVARIGGEADGCTTGLIWGDMAYLSDRVPELGRIGVDWLIDAGWAVYVTGEQARAIRAGATVTDLLAAGDRQQQTMFEALAVALTAVWGEPKHSARSEALYWRPRGSGAQVRLARHRRRRSADTICDIIVHPDARQADASDVAVPLDGSVAAAELVAQIVAKVRAAQGGANRPHPDCSPNGPDGAKKGETPTRRQRTVKGKKRGGCPAKADSKKKNTKTVQYNTVQYNTVQNTETLQKQIPPPQTDQTAPPQQKSQIPGGCGGKPGETAKLMESEATQPGAVPGPAGPSASRRGCERLGHVIKLYWSDPRAVAFGMAIAEVLTGRPIGDVQAEPEPVRGLVGAFAKLFWSEVMTTLPANEWPEFLEVAKRKARHARAKGKAPGGLLTKILRGEIASRSPPQAAER